MRKTLDTMEVASLKDLDKLCRDKAKEREGLSKDLSKASHDLED